MEPGRSHLRQAAARSVRWTAFGSLTVTALQVMQLTALARILEPSDFGLIAMILIVTSSGQIFADMGISAAIIHRQNSSREELSSLYWLNVVVGVALFVIILLAAPAVSALFGEPRLRALIPWAATVFLITPLGQQYQVILEKDLRFNTVTQYELAASGAGAAVAVGSALLGAGVYSLIAGQVSNASVRTLLLAAQGFRERPPLLHFRRSDLNGYLSFGLYQVGQRALNNLTSRADQFAIGIFVGAQGLGLYSLATTLVMMPVSRINPIVTRVAFPVFAMVQDDIARLRRGFFTLLRLISLIISPLLLGIAAVAPEAIPLVFGNQWRGAVPIVRLLAFVGIFTCLENPIGSLLLARGRPDIEFYWNVAALIVQVPIIFGAAYVSGTKGAAAAVLALEIFDLAVFALVVKRLLGVSMLDLGRVARPVAAGVAMVCLVIITGTLMDSASRFWLLAAQILAGAVVYLALVFAFIRDDLRELLSLAFPSFRRTRREVQEDAEPLIESTVGKI